MSRRSVVAADRADFDGNGLAGKVVFTVTHFGFPVEDDMITRLLLGELTLATTFRCF